MGITLVPVHNAHAGVLSRALNNSVPDTTGSFGRWIVSVREDANTLAHLEEGSVRVGVSYVIHKKSVAALVKKSKSYFQQS